MPFQSHLRDFSTAKAFSSAHACDLGCSTCAKRQPALITALRRIERVAPQPLTCMRAPSGQTFSDVNLGAEREPRSDGRL